VAAHVANLRRFGEKELMMAEPLKMDIEGDQRQLPAIGIPSCLCRVLACEPGKSCTR